MDPSSPSSTQNTITSNLPQNINNFIRYSPPISKSDLSNPSELHKLEDILTCKICLDLAERPLICSKCQFVYCKECLDINKCAYSNDKCPNCKCSHFDPGKILEKIYEKMFKFMCKNGCGKELRYSDLNQHYFVECPKIDYKEMFGILDRFKTQKLNVDVPSLNRPTKLSKFPFNCVKKSDHRHILIQYTRNNSWMCNICEEEYYEGDKSFYCYQCDFDCCLNCATDNENNDRIGNDYDSAESEYD